MHCYHEADSPRDAGSRDLIAGLGWVQRNIAVFGGDPNRGESAGHRGQHALRLTSGAGIVPGRHFGERRLVWAAAARDAAGRESEAPRRHGALRRVICPERGSTDLRKIAADKLPAGGRSHGMAWPIIDGWVILDDQYKLYEPNRYNDVPILVG